MNNIRGAVAFPCHARHICLCLWRLACRAARWPFGTMWERFVTKRIVVQIIFQSCTSMQSLRRSAARAFGSVAHGHGAHDIKNPTTDIVISLVLGECPFYAGLATSAIASRLLVFLIFIYALFCFFSFPLPCHAFVPLCIPHIVFVVVLFLR